MSKINLENITIVLQQPRYPENIGAAARAIHNMGIRNLKVVAPEDFDLPRVEKMATQGALCIADQIEIYEDLNEALSPFSYVFGTTARLGKQRQVITPSQMAEKLISISQQNRIAILFGPEDRGLTNEDLRLCHELVNIPTADFSSINLAQSVMIICYSIFTACYEEKSPFVPRLANRHELDGMYEQVKDILVRISYINPENPDYWMHHLRNFFTRIRVQAKEVSIIRGICRQIDWYGKKCYNDGIKERQTNETDSFR